MNKVSIIVAIYNVEKYLDKCLKSIQEQTYKDFICYCVNDGSSDNSKNIIEKYLVDSRFKLLEKENGGVSSARNFGLKNVNTEYVAFVDGDDFLEPNLLEECIKNINDTGTDILVFGYKQLYLNNNTSELIDLTFDDGVYSYKNKEGIFAFTPNAVWNKIYRTSLFKDNKIEFPEGFRHQDLGTTPKLLYKANSIQYINIPLYNYIIDRPNNITSQNDHKIYDILDMSNEVIGYLKNNMNDEYYENNYIDEIEYLIKANCIQSLRKSMNNKNKSFVFKFIDDVNRFIKLNFSRANHTYDKYFNKHDKIYLSKTLTKLYYLFNKQDI